MGTVHHLHRQANGVRPHTGEQLSRMTLDEEAVFDRLTDLKAEGEHVVAALERFNREHPVRHEVIGDADEGFAQDILSLIRENLAAATLGFLVGFAPFVWMLIYMVRS